MTVAGRTAPPLQGPAPFARWPAVPAAGLGVLALAIDVAMFPLASAAGQQSAATIVTVQQALEPAHLSLWSAEMAS
jgi:hypothetical protein